jgi:hypothetical protein
MDDFLDRELKQRLSRDPFPGGGFDERLRRRIEERIKESGRQRRGHTRSGRMWRWPAAAMVSFALFLLAVWLWGSGQQSSSNQMVSLQSEPGGGMAAALESAVTAAKEEKRYALLLGLRLDQKTPAGYPVSQYRTLLIGADQDPEKLRLLAELPSLYVPYGQHFWQIAAADGADGRQFLYARQATGANTASIQPGAISDQRLSELVAFAGNAYLSVHTYYKENNGEISVIRRIKQIDQLNEKAVHPADDPHVTPAQFLPDIRQYGEEWIIYRNPGAWVSELYDPGSESSYQLPDIPEAIVQHDSLSLSWEVILKTEPAARDAFSYGNLLGIVTDRELQVHALRGRQPVAGPVRVSLAEGEQVVMIQWAQNDKIDYVEKWTQLLGSLAESDG